MASLEITAEELSTIDTNQVAQMTLKDGTVIVINGGAEAQEAQGEEEFVQEEQAQEVEAQEGQVEENAEGQENQLRHRPMMGRVVPPMRPVVAPMRPIVPPVRPIVAPVPMRPLPPKPMIVPRGPVMRPAVVPGVFRGRPGMPVHRPPLVTQKVVPVPVPVPARRPVVPVPVPARPIHKPAVVPVPVPVHKPGLVRPMPVPVRPVAFRARPNTEQAEEEQQEEAVEYEQEEVPGEEQYADYEQEEEYQADDFRFRPMMRPVIPPPPRPFMRPRMPPMVPVMPHRRGPMMGYNTFQPRVFRARPRPRMVPAPMFTPLNATFQPKMYGPYGMRGPRYAPMPPMRPHLFRGKENTAEGEEQQQEYQECQEQQCETEQCAKSVCTKCGKEF